jgi:2-phosphoglycolate phosphatase
MIRAVLFDLDGTLMDSTDAIVNSYFHTFDTIGEPRPERGTVIATIGDPIHKQFPTMTSHDVDECIRIYRAYYAEHSAAITTLPPGVEETLATLSERGIKLGFVTSKRREAAEMLLEHLGALHYMDVRIGPLEVTQHKPHPEPVQKAMEILGVTPDETVFVGDMHFDVLAGLAAGVETIAVATGYQTRAQLEALNPDATCDTMYEVRDHSLGLL